MPRLKNIVERSDTYAGRAFDFSIQILIVLSLIAFSIETLPDLDPKWIKILHIFEVVTVLVFTGEYLISLFWELSRIKILS